MQFAAGGHHAAGGTEVLPSPGPGPDGEAGAQPNTLIIHLDVRALIKGTAGTGGLFNPMGAGAEPAKPTGEIVLMCDGPLCIDGPRNVATFCSSPRCWRPVRS